MWTCVAGITLSEIKCMLLSNNNKEFILISKRTYYLVLSFKLFHNISLFLIYNLASSSTFHYNINEYYMVLLLNILSLRIYLSISEHIHKGNSDARQLGCMYNII